MPATFRLDLHRRLWIELSNPYWYHTSKAFTNLYLKSKVLCFLTKYDRNFHGVNLYETGTSFGCAVSYTCTKCPLRSSCTDNNEKKVIVSLFHKWEATLDAIENSSTKSKTRKLRIKHVFRACSLAQQIAFVKVDDITFDESYYRLIDDMSNDIEISRKIHY
jgi:hypothetical protein